MAAVFLSGCGGSSSAPPPPPAPTVTAVTPANNATGVSITAPDITATFSEAMTASTFTASTFTLTSSNGAVTGTVSYSSSNDQATFTPSAALAYNTSYTATV
ncbi:MAG TPA: Ig-like domain-containing protein, partial [Terracidiphilus sp.]|nr:Ig-like domain-containing protein [Terracidiphilus sp.]